MKDRTRISKETHELNYVLKKFEKRQTKSNRAALSQALDSFKSDAEFLPHTRRQFYQYAEQVGTFMQMEDRKRF